MTDKSATAMFWRSHAAVMDKLHTYNEIMTGPNPLTDDERRQLADKYPARYGFMRPMTMRPLRGIPRLTTSELRDWLATPGTHQIVVGLLTAELARRTIVS